MAFNMMLSPAQQAREQEFPPLLFSLQPETATPRGTQLHRDSVTLTSEMRQRRSMTSGSVHTEGTPQAQPPPMSRLMDDVTMEDVGTGGRSARQVLSPPVFSLAGAGATPGAQPALVPAVTGTAQGVEQYTDVWITVYGFTQADVPLILKEFAVCGDIMQWGAYGVPQANFIHIQYQNKYAAQRALLRNGEQLSSSLIIGVKGLDPRHRAAIAEHSAGSQTDALQIQRPDIQAERPYRLEQSGVAQQIPRPTRSFASKVAQFVLGI